MIKLTQHADGGLRYLRQQVSVSGGDVTCARCQDKVYQNEERKAQGKSWHINCFCCATCRRPLTNTTCCSHSGDIYCDTCHRRQFGTLGYGHGLSTQKTIYDIHVTFQPRSDVDQLPVRGDLDLVAINHMAVGAELWSRPLTDRSLSVTSEPHVACAYCTKPVYHAEEVKAASRVWHRGCLRCMMCQRALDSVTCCTHDGDVFCSLCYRRQSAPAAHSDVTDGQTVTGDNSRSRESGIGARRVSMTRRGTQVGTQVGQMVQEATVHCPSCQQPVYHAEQVKVKQQYWHRSCLRCGACKTPLSLLKLALHEGTPHCAACYSRLYGPDKHSRPDKSSNFR